MADRWRDENRDERGGADFDRERSFGERGYRDYGRGYGRDYGSEHGRYGGLAGRGTSYNPRSDYDRGPFPYSPEYGEGPLYPGGSERRGDYGRTPLAAYGRGGEGYGGFGREDIRAPGGWQDYGRDDTFREQISRGWDRSAGEVGRLTDEGPGGRLGFRGRGPKGYTRSDERIREDLCDRLTDDPIIDASDIDVRASDGEVTLSGTVDDRSQKRRAEDCAESISGVKNVQNLLRVEHPLELTRERGRAEGAPASQPTAGRSEPTRTTSGAPERETA